MRKLIFLLILLIGCGTLEDKQNKRTPRNKEIENLKQVVLQLQGTVAQINAFTASDFSNCTTGLPPFETKICQIAQTSTAEQRVLFASQLSAISKMFQDELYGEDCTNETETGCPVSGSIISEVESLGTDITTFSTDIAALQIQTTQLESDLLILEGRLNNFNGSGDSIETVLTSIDNDIVLLESRITDIENSINSDTVFQAVALCGDISSSGPIFETLLLSGDKQSITAYLEDGNDAGLGQLKIVDDGQGDIYLNTTLNTRRCNFKVYEYNSELKVCWNNSNRRANESSIDNECDFSGGFVNPTGNCTCTE